MCRTEISGRNATFSYRRVAHPQELLRSLVVFSQIAWSGVGGEFLELFCDVLVVVVSACQRNVEPIHLRIMILQAECFVYPRYGRKQLGTDPHALFKFSFELAHTQVAVTGLLKHRFVFGLFNELCRNAIDWVGLKSSLSEQVPEKFINQINHLLIAFCACKQ